MTQEGKKPSDIRELLRENTFAHFAIATVAGIVAAEWADGGLSSVQAFAIAALCLGIYSVWIAGSVTALRKSLPLLLLMLIFSAAGYLRFATFRKNVSADWPEAARTCYAKAEGAVRETGKTLQTDLRLRNGRKLRATLMKHEGEKPRPGDVVLIHGNISAPRNAGNPEETDYAAYLLKHGYSGTVFCFANCWTLTGDEDATLRDRLLRTRDRLTDRYRNYFSGRELAVLAALTLGDKTMLRAETREVFSETGTSHILALSGLHLGLLFGIYNWLLMLMLRHTGRGRRWKEIAGFVIGLLLMWLFTLLAGMPLSLTRAALMYSLAQLSVLLRRDVFSLNNLALAATVILMLSPEALFDVGFQLSFLSVLGIFLLMPMFPKIRNRGRNRAERMLAGCGIALWDIFCVSVSAIIFTLPLVARTFHTVPLWGCAASLVAVPLTAALLISALLFFTVPFAQGALAAVTGWLLSLLFGSMEAIAALPYASIDLYPSAATVVLLYLFIFIAVSYVSRHNIRKIAALAAILVCIVATEVRDARRHVLRPQIVFYNIPAAPALHVIETKSRSYLWTTMPERADSALAYVRRTFWKRYGIAEPARLTGDTAAASFAFTPHALSFRGCRIGLAYERLNGSGENPLRVDYLFIVKGWKRPVAEALRSFSPDTVVLDAGLSDFYRNKFSAEADSLKIPCHDIRKDGALVVTHLGN